VIALSAPVLFPDTQMYPFFPKMIETSRIVRKCCVPVICLGEASNNTPCYSLPIILLRVWACPFDLSSTQIKSFSAKKTLMLASSVESLYLCNPGRFNESMLSVAGWVERTSSNQR